MSLGLQEGRRRRQHQRRVALIKWLLILMLLFGAGAFAYATGSKLARVEVERLEENVSDLNAQLDDLRGEKAALQKELGETEEALTTWKQRYESEVPRGHPAELLDLVKQRLANGMAAERLTFVIQQAQTEASCDLGPITRRFLVRTPLSRGAADSVSFADNTITLTATGISATDAQGRPEAWFDPAEAIEVTIRRPGGQAQSVKGSPPLHPAIVAGGHEHRFSIVRGDRTGFVKATWQRCDYP